MHIDICLGYMWPRSHLAKGTRSLTFVYRVKFHTEFRFKSVSPGQQWACHAFSLCSSGGLKGPSVPLASIFVNWPPHNFRLFTPYQYSWCVPGGSRMGPEPEKPAGAPGRRAGGPGPAFPRCQDAGLRIPPSAAFSAVLCLLRSVYSGADVALKSHPVSHVPRPMSPVLSPKGYDVPPWENLHS